MLPLVLGSLAESLIAFRRISTFLKADELAEPYAVDRDSNIAVHVDADFAWEVVEKAESKFKTGDKTEKTNDKKMEKTKNEKASPVLPVTALDDEKASGKTAEKPFELMNLKMTVPKGSFVAIVGKVGSGKVCTMFSLLVLRSF